MLPALRQAVAEVLLRREEQVSKEQFATYDENALALALLDFFGSEECGGSLTLTARERAVICKGLSALSEIAPKPDQVARDHRDRIVQLEDALLEIANAGPTHTGPQLAHQAREALGSIPSATRPSTEAIAFDVKMTLHALLDRDITFVGRNAVLPFESHDQAMNHISEARRKGQL